MNWTKQRVIVTGGAGFLGSHLVKALQERGCTEILAPRSVDYDLRFPGQIKLMFDYFGQTDMVFNLAANVGGIGYNQYNAYNLYFDNILIGSHMIDQSIIHSVKKFVQIGTVCAYPKFTPAPFSEFNLWNGYPEETNAPYGLAKKMLLVQLQAARDQYGFNGIYLVPTNLYGPGDEFNPARSHVIPALIKKCVEAVNEGKDQIEAWGSGSASRDFLYVDDAVEAIVLAAEKYNRSAPLNLGSGDEVRIISLLYLISKLTGYESKVKWDTNKPDGQPRRSLDTKEAKAALGWKAQTSLKDGLIKTIEWYKQSIEVKADARN